MYSISPSKKYKPTGNEGSSSCLDSLEIQRFNISDEGGTRLLKVSQSVPQGNSKSSVHLEGKKRTIVMPFGHLIWSSGRNNNVIEASGLV
jgi:hypothetical protein